MTGTREPRKRNAAATKARILATANRMFAEQGYARTGLRDIAREADVASSLIVRYFRTKAGLFEAALIDTIAANSVFSLEKSGFGTRMAQLMVEQSNVTITTMLVLALGDPESRQVVERVSHTHIIDPLAAWLGPPDAFERAMNLFSLMTGFVILDHALRSAAAPPSSLMWLSEALQQIVDAGAKVDRES